MTADISNLMSWWSSGNLVIGDTQYNSVLTICSSTGGILFGNAGGVTLSTGGIHSSNENKVTDIVDYTLTNTDSGAVHYVTVSDVILTLPGAASSGKRMFFTVINACTTAGQVVIKTTDTTAEVIWGGNVGSSNRLIANTAATHKYGDSVQLVNTAASTTWSIVGMTGTWGSTT
jgi:hypothetical protein